MLFDLWHQFGEKKPVFHDWKSFAKTMAEWKGLLVDLASSQTFEGLCRFDYKLFLPYCLLQNLRLRRIPLEFYRE